MKKFSVIFLAAVSLASFGCKKKGGVMAAATDERDAMCKCTDKKCAENVEMEALKAAAEMMKGKSEEDLKKMDSDMSAEDKKKMADIETELEKCKARLMGGDKMGGDKPAGDKPAGDKPVEGDKPAGDKPAGDKPAAAGDMPAGLPAECKDYAAAMEKLASCDKMPQASKDAMKQGFDAMKTGWANFDKMPAEAQKAAGDACKQGTDALMQTGKAVCGW